MKEFLDLLSEKTTVKVLAVFKLVEDMEVIPVKFFKNHRNQTLSRLEKLLYRIPKQIYRLVRQRTFLNKLV